MKKITFIIVIVVSLITVYSFADEEGHMMGHMNSPEYGEKAKESGESLGYPVMGPGMMGCGMGPGHHQMMHGMMGSGMMGYGGCGMMGYGMGPGHHQMMHGMMGSGMMGYGGYGMMGPGMMWGYDPEGYKKYMDETVDLRRNLHNKRFEYFEAQRNPEARREDITNMEKEMWEIQKEINAKWQK